MLLKKEFPVSVYILVQGSLKKSIYAPWNSYNVGSCFDDNLIFQEAEDKEEMDMITYRENFNEINGLNIFGNFDILNLDKFAQTKDK